jgi:predicted anti-sigma-YlaC factor YlaD
MNCESFVDHVAGFLEGSLARPEREAARRHLETCADCRALFAALEASSDPGLADAILARTSGAACESARSRLCARVDGELSSFDAELVDGHLRHCTECGALARALQSLTDDLPRLAAIDPGPGFVEVVLARTSRRPRPVPLAERWAAAVSRLLERPRIALEGAFVAVVFVGLPLAVSPSPLAGGPTYAIEDVRGAMGDIEASVQVGVRSAWGTARAFVVENSIRLRPGTFDGPGASGQKRGGSDADDRNPESAQEKKR